jgi:glutaredoxin
LGGCRRFEIARQSDFLNIPRRETMAKPSVILYTRKGCHLCDDAQAILQAHGLAIQEIDVDADTQLKQRFDTCVPVVEIDGKIRFRGRIDERLLRRLLAGSGPSK